MKKNNMKNLVAILFLGILSFTGCNANLNGGNGTPNVEVQSAYDKLSADEKMVFDALKKNLSSFYDQSSVRVVAASMLYESMGLIDLKIQGKNKLGGTVTKIYTLCYKTTKWTADSGKEYTEYFGEMEESYFQTIRESDDVSVAKLNAALKEYFEEMGLA